MVLAPVSPNHILGEEQRREVKPQLVTLSSQCVPTDLIFVVITQ